MKSNYDFASRNFNLGTETAFTVLAKANKLASEGQNIINLGIGQPDFKTPEHIVPVWYFTPFYAILRAIPDKLGGVIAMGLAIFVLFLMPWIDRCKVKSIRYRSSTYKILLASFVISFIGLGYIGMQAPTPILTALGRAFTLIYFAFFVVLYFTSKNEKTKPVPERVTMHE